ncbi:hypothetical protein OROHE_007489 [Orobanche hederae]
MDSTVAVQGCLPSGVVTLEEARRLMKIGPERRSSKVDNNPPIYIEDVERAGEEQTKEYVAMALDHYNATTEGPKYELVEAVGVDSIVHIGLWYHVCFIAKPVSTATDASPKHFFAEIAYHLGNAISCRIMDLNSSDTIHGCGECAPNAKMYHPRGGFQVGDWPYREPVPIHEGYYDASVPMERRIKV